MRLSGGILVKFDVAYMGFEKCDIHTAHILHFRLPSVLQGLGNLVVEFEDGVCDLRDYRERDRQLVIVRAQYAEADLTLLSLEVIARRAYCVGS